MAPTQLGYYRIDRMLGEGGMGAVYAATHLMTGRRAAIKTLRAELAQRPDLDARFFNEARTMSFLEHPGIVRVYDVGRTPDGVAYMVMEHCDGPTLGEAMRAATRVEVRLSLLRAVAEALAYAHGQGVVHRDLKPDNIIVTGSLETVAPKVLDFGIAKVLDGAVAAGSPFAVKTRTGTAMGTPLYMSPEQCRGVGGITQASDCYSFGIMLFEAVAGHVPFDGGVGEVIVHHLTSPTPPLPWPDDTTQVDARPGINALIQSLLDKKPEQRPSMTEVVDALASYAAFRTELVTAARPIESWSEPLVPAANTNTAPPVVVGRTNQSAIVPSRSKAPFVIAIVGAVLVIVTAISLRKPAPHEVPRAAAPNAVMPQLVPAPTEPARTQWLLETKPPGADVASADGHIIGRTPFSADEALLRGERELYLRKSGFQDELVHYDGHALNSVALRPRPRKTPITPSAPPTPATDENFVVQPLH